MLDWNDVVNFAIHGNPSPPSRVEKTAEEWKAQVSPEVYYVTRERGTERAYSSAMCSLFEPGVYECVCCQTPLFDSVEKFESGTGWPSFTQSISVEVVAYHKDVRHGMSRIEAACNVCDAHLGHVFPDGPAPSGLRYCMNALSLRKI